MRPIAKLMLLGTTYVISNVATANVSISPLQPQAEGENFPVVTIAKRPLASKTINTLLQLEHLEHLPNVYKKSPFETVQRNEKNCCGSVSFDSWQKLTTPKNILSITLSGGAVSAYPVEFDVYENFDTRSGNTVLLDHLIKPTQKNALNAMLIAHAKNQIRRFLKSPKEPAQNADEASYLSAQKVLYENCLKGFDSVQLDWFNFYVKKTSVVFTKERCSSHAMRSLDEIGKFHIDIPISTLKPYLSAYGNNVLSNAKQRLNHKGIAGKLLTGKLGKAKVHFLIKEVYQDGSIVALYWYDKYKQPIELNGTFSGNQLQASESYYDEAKKTWIKRATIQATWQGGKLTGTWRNVTTHQSYSLHLAE